MLVALAHFLVANAAKAFISTLYDRFRFAIWESPRRFVLYIMMENHLSKCQVNCSQYIKRSAANVTHPACSIFTHDPLLVFGVILDSCLEVPLNRKYFIFWVFSKTYWTLPTGLLYTGICRCNGPLCHLVHSFSSYSLSTFRDAHTNGLVLMQFLDNSGRSCRLMQCYSIPAASDVNDLFRCWDPLPWRRLPCTIFRHSLMNKFPDLLHNYHREPCSLLFELP